VCGRWCQHRDCDDEQRGNPTMMRKHGDLLFPAAENASWRSRAEMPNGSRLDSGALWRFGLTSMTARARPRLGFGPHGGRISATTPASSVRLVLEPREQKRPAREGPAVLAAAPDASGAGNCY